MTPAGFVEDRSMRVAPNQTVLSRWITIDACTLGCRDRMDCVAIERAYRRYLQLGDAQVWPPLVGRWDGERFRVLDGRHELLALMALGREKVLVAWVEER